MRARPLARRGSLDSARRLDAPPHDPFWMDFRASGAEIAYAYTPDRMAGNLGPTTTTFTIDVRGDFYAPLNANGVMASHWNATALDRQEYMFGFDADGYLRFQWANTNNTIKPVAVCPVRDGVPDGTFATRRVTVNIVSGLVEFFISLDGTTFTALGSVTVGTTTTVRASTTNGANLIVGTYNGATAAVQARGRWSRVQIVRDGTTLLNCVVGPSSCIDTTGTIWFSGGAGISNYASPLTQKHVRQTKTASSGGTSQYSINVTLPSPALAGSLLLLYVSIAWNATSFTIPAGFAYAAPPHSAGSWASGAVFFKVATGGEQTFALAYSMSSSTQITAAAIELVGLRVTGALDQSGFKNGNAALARSITVGPTEGTSEGDELAIAFWSNNNASNINTVSTQPAWSDDFVLVFESGCRDRVTTNAPAFAAGLKAIPLAATAVQTTLSYGGGGTDENIAYLLTLRKK